MKYADKVYVGGVTTGETGVYTVIDTDVDSWYSNDGPNVWIRNATKAQLQGAGTCPDHGDSGGTVFSIVNGEIQVAGTYSGWSILRCNILFTDVYRSFLALPGGPLLH